jgi:hypothetical protein
VYYTPSENRYLCNATAQSHEASQVWELMRFAKTIYLPQALRLDEAIIQNLHQQQRSNTHQQQITTILHTRKHTTRYMLPRKCGYHSRIIVLPQDYYTFSFAADSVLRSSSAVSNLSTPGLSAFAGSSTTFSSSSAVPLLKSPAPLLKSPAPEAVV